VDDSTKSLDVLAEQINASHAACMATAGEAVRRAIAANQKAVDDYRAGKDASIKFLVGQVMRETRGRANAQVVQGLLERELQEND